MTAWSRERPSKAGWYWFRSEQILSIVLISPYGNVTIPSVGLRTLKRMAGEWQGPLTPNEATE